MAAAAAAFLAALTEAQRGRACRAFGDERRDWSFLPEPDRDGLPIGALDDGQRRLAHELIVAGTSLPGYTKVVSVMAMEHVLRALAPGLADLFDPERYSFRVFGSPGERGLGLAARRASRVAQLHRGGRPVGVAHAVHARRRARVLRAAGSAGR